MRFFRRRQGEIFLTLCAMIWGSSLIPQKMGSLYLGPFSFGAARFLLGAVVFFPISLLLGRREHGVTPCRPGILALGGSLCGIALFLGAFFQQRGLAATTVGKAGFITAMYIVLIPVFGLFLHRKTAPIIWAGISLAAVGLYFLCISETFAFSQGDFYVLIGAIFWAIQIMLVDSLANKVNSLHLVLIEFIVAGVLSAVAAAVWESPAPQAFAASLFPILYSGIMVVGVAYTLQALGQKTVNPSVAGLIFSTESVFGVLSGALVLHEVMNARELFGCILMFCALIVTQLKLPSFKAVQQAIQK